MKDECDLCGMHQASILQQRLNHHYPQIRLLDDLHMQDCYVFPCYGLLQTLAGLVDVEDGYVEVFKIDYCPQSGIPTLNLILSGTVDMVLLDAVFERYQSLLQIAATAYQP
jgi:hypothetical protein